MQKALNTVHDYNTDRPQAEPSGEAAQCSGKTSDPHSTVNASASNGFPTGQREIPSIPTIKGDLPS